MRYVSVSELKELVDSHKIQIIDVRTPEDWISCRIPGAFNVPYWKFSSVSHDHEINSLRRLISGFVYYCGSELLSGLCAQSFPEGVEAAILKGGLQAWISRGFPTECDEEFSDTKLERYRPQVRTIGERAQERLLKARVGIIGLGGLGCSAAQYLYGAGIGSVILVDNDIISESNLHRQILYGTNDVGKLKVSIAADALIHINKHVRTIAITDRLNSGNAVNIIDQCQVILDCTDNYESRLTLHNAARIKNIPVVYGASQGMQGEVAVFTPGGSCYSCMSPPVENVEQNCSIDGAFGPICGMVGSMQAAETIKIITNMGCPLYSRLVRFDVLNGKIYQIKLNKRDNCPLCSV
jgi:molybdopterin/thiamine biosynthesis adenylyltransferase/rhodanese-related sulfurtransferase